ncbi:hypothetical protein EIP91_008322 [Steccherinum ochraceum]|uniref:Urease accessory protein UreF n=1 Tax=Steccherinum ochraceum TaxID=92696 RepID=A0A4R0RU44_9APHY|nr:hypothetical protein EIP91_008322 [Steccherinum ochraceum]
MDGDEAYLLLLLSDSNLPTGSFVASSGLESYVTHGFLTGGPSSEVSKSVPSGTGPIVDFVRSSLSTYSRSALPFVADAHQLVQSRISQCEEGHDVTLQETLKDFASIDDLYDTMTLNHITRRASTSQGVALLTLYSKGFARPISKSDSTSEEDKRDLYLSRLIDELKLSVRRGDTPGHLPTCWGVLTGALGLSLERSQFLHLFLYARGLLSAAVRMNNLGPYGAQQLLLHTIRPLVEQEAKLCSHLRTGLNFPSTDSDDLGTLDGPAMTWPLGEVLAGRHDLQHSRVFNS